MFSVVFVCLSKEEKGGALSLSQTRKEGVLLDHGTRSIQGQVGDPPPPPTICTGLTGIRGCGWYYLVMSMGGVLICSTVEVWDLVSLIQIGARRDIDQSARLIMEALAILNKIRFGLPVLQDRLVTDQVNWEMGRSVCERMGTDRRAVPGESAGLCTREWGQIGG